MTASPRRHCTRQPPLHHTAPRPRPGNAVPPPGHAPAHRVEGRAKVTGTARYAAEYSTDATIRGSGPCLAGCRHHCGRPGDRCRHRRDRDAARRAAGVVARQRTGADRRRNADARRPAVGRGALPRRGGRAGGGQLTGDRPGGGRTAAGDLRRTRPRRAARSGTLRRSGRRTR